MTTCDYTTECNRNCGKHVVSDREHFRYTVQVIPVDQLIGVMIYNSYTTYTLTGMILYL